MSCWKGGLQQTRKVSEGSGRLRWREGSEETALGHGIRRINGAGEVLGKRDLDEGKGPLCHILGLPLSHSCKRRSQPQPLAVISQAHCTCSRLLTLPCPLYLTHLCSTLRKEAEVTLNGVTFCLYKYSELAGVRSEPRYLKADDKYV